jgi:hypothetical protein
VRNLVTSPEELGTVGEECAADGTLLGCERKTDDEKSVSEPSLVLRRFRYCSDPSLQTHFDPGHLLDHIEKGSELLEKRSPFLVGGIFAAITIMH